MKRKGFIIAVLTLCLLIVGFSIYFFALRYKEDNVVNSFVNAKAIDDANVDDESEVKISFVNNNQFDSLGITNEMNDVIRKYFIRYFSALGSYNDYHFNDLFCYDAVYQCGISNTMIDYQNAIRRNMTVDLKYPSATVGVNYISATEKDGTYDIYLCANDFMNYNFISDTTSYTCDIEHHFVLKEENGIILIFEHSEISGVYNLIKDRIDSFLGDNNYTPDFSDGDTILAAFSSLGAELAEGTSNDLKKINEQKEEFNSDPEKYKAKKSSENFYDSKKALDYSYKWAGQFKALRNPVYTAYDIYGGNCNNYTSQCLLAGGIPMDITGNQQWKWYGEDIKNDGGREGRSMSWASVESFYLYCHDNRGSGMVAETDSNIYSGRPGDIIQYVSDGIGVHSVIITKVIYDESGNVIDYLINSNTVDKVDCPMSAYGYTDIRLIKIIGYNY